MKVMLCHDYYKLPGGEDQVFHDENWLLEDRGHSVIQFRKFNDDVDEMSRLEIARATIWNAAVRKELDQLISQEKPDIVHFHNTFPLISPAAYSAAKRHNVPVVQTLHNFRLICPGSTLLRNGSICEKCVKKTFAWPSIMHGCYKNSKSATGVVAMQNAFHRWRGTWKNDVDIFIALTNHSRDIFVNAGLPADKFVVKPNFVRPDPGQRVSEGEYAIYAGRLSQEKGIDVLLKAWVNHNITVPLVVIGDGPMRNQVVTASADNANITWFGQLPFEEVLQKIRAAKMLVMPSVWYETFGRTMIEAFAAGVPVIASDLGAMKEIVSDGQNGLHFAAGSPEDLATAVNSLANNDRLRASTGTQARQEFLEKFSAEKNYDLLMSIYEKAKLQ